MTFFSGKGEGPSRKSHSPFDIFQILVYNAFAIA